MLTKSMGKLAYYSDMPDYQNAILLFDVGVTNISSIPIVKINAPLYILANSTNHVVGNLNAHLAVFPTPDNRGPGVVLAGRSNITDTTGGGIMVPVTPGLSTYGVLASLTSNSRPNGICTTIVLIPTIGTTSWLKEHSLSPSNCITITDVFHNMSTSWYSSNYTIPGDSTWTSTFRGDWRDNF